MEDKMFWFGTLTLISAIFIVIFTTLFLTKKWTNIRNLINLTNLLKILLLSILTYLIMISISFMNIKIKKTENDDIKNKTIIILGNPASASGQPSEIMKSRLDNALYLEKQLINPTIIVTGSAVYNNFFEAEVMKKYLVLNGVNSQRIIIESKAKNTYENAQYSCKLLDSLNLKNPIIITSHFHYKRTKKIFKQFISDFTIETTYPNFWLFIKQYPIYLWETFLILKM